MNCIKIIDIDFILKPSNNKLFLRADKTYHVSLGGGVACMSCLLVVPRVSKSRMGGRAFSNQAPLCGISCQ